jgi:enoyl reductase-like protein
LIGDIADAEMQMTLNTKVFSIMNKVQKRLQEDTQVESSLTDEDIKNYTNQVIQELIQRKKPR